MRRLIIATALVLVALVIELLLGRQLAGRDLLVAVLGRHDVSALVLTCAALGTRLFLIFLAPAWLVWQLVDWLVLKRAAR